MTPEQVAEVLARPAASDPEVHRSIRNVLEENIRAAIASRRPGVDSLEEVSRRLGKERRRSWRRLRWPLAMVAWGLLVICWLTGFLWEDSSFHSIGGETPGWFTDLERLLPSHRPERYTSHPWPEALKREWEEHPGEIWRYLEYSSSLLNDHRPLDPDFESIWRSRDPDNGVWLALELDSLDRYHDLGYAEEGARLLQELQHFKRFDPYGGPFTREREQQERDSYAGEPSPWTWQEAAKRVTRPPPGLDAYFCYYGDPSGPMRARARQLLERGDWKGLSDFLATCRRVLLLLQSQGAYRHYPVSHNGDYATYGLASIAEKAWLLDEVDKLHQLEDSAWLLPPVADPEMGYSGPEWVWPAAKATPWSSWYGGPGSRAVSVMTVRRFALVLSAGLLLLVVPAGLGVPLFPRLLGRVAAGMGDRLLPLSSGVKVVGIGILPPLLWCAARMALSPVSLFSEISENLAEEMAAFTAATGACGAWLLRRETGRRCGLAGLPGAGRVDLALAVLGWAAFLPLGGYVVRTSSWGGFLSFRIGMAGLVVIGLVARAIWGMGSQRDQPGRRLAEMIVVRRLGGILLTAAAMMILSVPVLVLVEQHLVSGPVDSLWAEKEPPPRDYSAYDARMRELAEKWR